MNSAFDAIDKEPQSVTLTGVQVYKHTKSEAHALLHFSNTTLRALLRELRSVGVQVGFS